MCNKLLVYKMHCETIQTASRRTVISNIMQERSEIWTEVTVKNAVFWSVTFVTWYKVTGLLKQGTASVFRVEHSRLWFCLPILLFSLPCSPPRWRQQVYPKLKISTKLYDVTLHFIVFFTNYVPEKLLFCISLFTELTEFFEKCSWEHLKIKLLSRIFYYHNVNQQMHTLH